MVEVSNVPLDLQRLVQCNEALRVLLYLHDADTTRHNCNCKISTSKTGGITGRPLERHSEASLELLDADEKNDRYRQLIAAIKLLKEDLDAEKQRAAQQRSRRVCADILRFFLFLLGICAVIAVCPAR
ncbi:unnamed protein product [Calypogeia fissa]